LSCGEDAVVVGAYSTYWPTVQFCRQSGYGPRRTAGVRKPDISAPGYMIRLHRSKFKTYEPDAKRSFESGTSLSAPFVAGTIACLFEVAPKAKLSTIKEALTSTARTGLGSSTPSWHPQLGYGRLYPSAAVQWMKGNGRAKDA
jgi:subtilisin family serine protease